ncbi:hypothetical protein TSAR_009654 [Trichomalopsis sarcophagae]|uniref:Uncharacterized protein n=1 Tax=Trichomalopsis sarcophagae TaxID=543379 RepID=A0A232ELA8_9HYME|nr:hypothetical protein TSAR_009654 [Trichomalopsis sarcophagae]
MAAKQKVTYWDKRAPGVRRRRSYEAYSFPTARMKADRKPKVKVLRPVREGRRIHASRGSDCSIASMPQEVSKGSEEMVLSTISFTKNLKATKLPQEILWVLYQVSFKLDCGLSTSSRLLKGTRQYKENQNPNNVKFFRPVRPEKTKRKSTKPPSLVTPTIINVVPENMSKINCSSNRHQNMPLLDEESPKTNFISDFYEYFESNLIQKLSYTNVIGD